MELDSSDSCESGDDTWSCDFHDETGESQEIIAGVSWKCHRGGVIEALEPLRHANACLGVANLFKSCCIDLASFRLGDFLCWDVDWMKMNLRVVIFLDYGGDFYFDWVCTTKESNGTVSINGMAG